MKKVHPGLFLGLVCAALQLGAENPSFNDAGTGTRAMALGNNFTALADDFTAVYWNPAGLAFMPIREMQVALDALNMSTSATLNGVSDTARLQRLRISHLGLVRSVPVARGGFAFAVGLVRPVIFDNVYSYRGQDRFIGITERIGNYYDLVGNVPVGDTLRYGDILHYQEAVVQSSGQINLIPVSVGWQIAPAIGFGLTVAPLFGRENQIQQFQTSLHGALFEYSEQKTARYFYGVDARVGLLYAPGERVRLGLRLTMPSLIAVTQNVTYRDRYYTDYVITYRDEKATLITPLSGALGAALSLGRVQVSPQLEFRAPFADATPGADRSFWRLGGGAGVSVPLPALSTVLRAGYGVRQLDMYHYGLEWEDETFSTETDLHTDQLRHSGSVGFTWLLKDYAAIEAAYAYSSWRYAVHDPEFSSRIAERHHSHRAQLSFSLRW